MDERVFNELKKVTNNNDNKKSIFPEHEFLVTCLRIGLKIEDLKILTYIDVLKIFISFCGVENVKESSNGTRKATQEDIQNLVARM